MKQMTKRVTRYFTGFILLLPCFTTFLLSCGTKTCPAFSDAMFEQWFPYGLNQSFVFTSTNSISDTLKIAYTTRSEAYETSANWDRPACKEPEASISGNAAQLNFNVHAGNASNYIMLSFGSNPVLGSGIKDSGIVVIKSSFLKSSSFQSSFVLNGKNYTQVQFFEMDTTTQKPAVYKLWISKGKGVIGYQKRIGNGLFALQ